MRPDPLEEGTPLVPKLLKVLLSRVAFATDHIGELPSEGMIFFQKSVSCFMILQFLGVGTAMTDVKFFEALQDDRITECSLHRCYNSLLPFRSGTFGRSQGPPRA